MHARHRRAEIRLYGDPNVLARSENPIRGNDSEQASACARAGRLIGKADTRTRPYYVPGESVEASITMAVADPVSKLPDWPPGCITLSQLPPPVVLVSAVQAINP